MQHQRRLISTPTDKKNPINWSNSEYNKISNNYRKQMIKYGYYLEDEVGIEPDLIKSRKNPIEVPRSQVN